MRGRVLAAAAALIASGGVAALTTRAVAAAAGTQAPTLYRLFGDKRGLLDAVAEHGLAAYVATKAESEPHPDPVQDLRVAWDDYVAFGLANPAVFAIMHEAGATLPASPAALAGIAVLRERVARIARAGRLRMPVERAVGLIHAVGVGTVSTLLAIPASDRDPTLAETARDAVFGAIVSDASVTNQTDLAPLALALHSRLGETDGLSAGERMLMAELLMRLATHSKAS